MALKYKKGDRVLIKDIDWYNENKDKNGNIVFSSKVPHFALCVNVRTVFTKDMVKYCGKVVTIENVWTANYSIVEGTHRDYFTDEMIEGLVEEEMSLDKAGQITDFEYEGLAYTLPEGYQFKDENGNIINATKIVLEKKKKEYPKTYEECYKIMGVKLSDCYIQGYKSPLLEDLQELLICRDAYWKIAGEELGLGKPWEPDWENSEERRYSIVNIEGDINLPEKTLTKWILKVTNKILVFSTEEMRDAFYENFKELIKMCKELL